MSKWKMVPSSLTPEMWAAGARTKGLETSYEAMLAAAPKWEPSEADVEVAVQAYRAELTRIYDAVDQLTTGDGYNAMRAALKAAVGGHDEH